MNIGILTGGGDCPGLNAAIRGVTRRAIDTYNYNVVGIKNGWDGLIKGDVEPLNLDSISGILPKGGTILGTSRKNPLKSKDSIEKIKDHIKKFDLGALTVIGDEDALLVSHEFGKSGIGVVGLPKTIDNDIYGTDFTFGFDTAINIVTNAVDRLHSTAESHHRVMVIEVMGRNTGWIAVSAGIAGGADCILIPEVPSSIHEICELIEKRRQRGKSFSIVVVAEGANITDLAQESISKDKIDDFGHIILGGIGDLLGHEIEALTNIETRVMRLGHVQRGGKPTAFDRVLATRMGVEAADMVSQEKYGFMVGLKGSSLIHVPLVEVVTEKKVVDNRMYEIAQVFFG